ncbi:unnamed protein product, partial [marine sediment metagenome]
FALDGNGRWAERRQLPRMAGHEEGVKATERVIKAAIEKKIKILTLFAFGIENWGRPAEEVNFLMRLFITNLEEQAEQFIKNNIQLRVIGDRSRIAPLLQAKIIEVQEKTANNDGLILVIAFNYSGRWDMLQAVRTLSARVAKGELASDDISMDDIQQALCLADLPEPDLFIRTSGEQRLSNFLLWQLAYTELFFTPVLWPDFDATAFDEALQNFSQRQRRYGLVC